MTIIHSWQSVCYAGEGTCFQDLAKPNTILKFDSYVICGYVQYIDPPPKFKLTGLVPAVFVWVK